MVRELRWSLLKASTMICSPMPNATYTCRCCLDKIIIDPDETHTEDVLDLAIKQHMTTCTTFRDKTFYNLLTGCLYLEQVLRNPPQEAIEDDQDNLDNQEMMDDNDEGSILIEIPQVNEYEELLMKVGGLASQCQIAAEAIKSA